MRGRPGYPPADRRVAECSDLAALLGSGGADRVPLPAQCPGPADGAFWASRDCPHPASECTLVQVLMSPAGRRWSGWMGNWGSVGCWVGAGAEGLLRAQGRQGLCPGASCRACRRWTAESSFKVRLRLGRCHGRSRPRGEAGEKGGRVPCASGHEGRPQQPFPCDLFLFRQRAEAQS